jgi:Transcriptional regulators
LQQHNFDHIGVTVSRKESSSQSTKLIKHAYRQVFDKKIDQDHVYNKAKDFKGGNLGAQYLLEKDPDLQVIFANSDQVAAGVIQQLIKMKKKIPVIGQEDLDYSRLMDFSTVDHKLTEIGEYAFWSIFEKDVVKKMIPSELILRGTLNEE